MNGVQLEIAKIGLPQAESAAPPAAERSGQASFDEHLEQARRQEEPRPPQPETSQRNAPAPPQQATPSKEPTEESARETAQEQPVADEVAPDDAKEEHNEDSQDGGGPLPSVAQPLAAPVAQLTLDKLVTDAVEVVEAEGEGVPAPSTAKSKAVATPQPATATAVKPTHPAAELPPVSVPTSGTKTQEEPAADASQPAIPGAQRAAVLEGVPELQAPAANESAPGQQPSQPQAIRVAPEGAPPLEAVPIQADNAQPKNTKGPEGISGRRAVEPPTVASAEYSSQAALISTEVAVAAFVSQSEALGSETAAAPVPSQPEPAPQPPEPPQASNVPAGEPASNKAPSFTLPGRGAIQAASMPSMSEADRARFVQRVARAFEAAGEGGQMRLRLSPPELGSLRMDVSVRQGVLTAHVEAETPQARMLLLDNLPALRERLQEQNIKIERFDVDLMNQSADRQPQGYRQRDRNGSDEAPYNAPRSTTTAAVPEDPRPAVARRLSGGDRLNVVV